MSKHHKHKNKFCDCPVSDTIPLTPDFDLECGSSLKIFESDEPTEIYMSIVLNERSPSQDLCDLKVFVELQDGEVLVFNIPNPNFTAGTNEANGISFYSKDTRKVTLECQRGTGVGCRGTSNLDIVLRDLKIDHRCKCPVNDVLFRNEGFRIKCGEIFEIFKSNKPTELAMQVNLTMVTGLDSCDLKVIVELENGDVLEFDIPKPNSPSVNVNEISFYSKNVLKATLECQRGTDVCAGTWIGNVVLRGLRIDD